MVKKQKIHSFLNGIMFGLGFVCIISLIGAVFAVGFHYANEILPGTFTGNYKFDGDVNITSGNDLCIEGGKCLSAARVSSVLITTADLADNSVTSAKIVNGAVTSADIADGTITNLDIANNAINSVKIVDGSITSADLAANSVGSSHIIDGSIASADINSAQIQRRVTGTCPAGQAIRVISSTGTVTCQSASSNDYKLARCHADEGSCSPNCGSGYTLISTILVSTLGGSTYAGLCESN